MKNDIIIKVDAFLTNTRILRCLNRSCRFADRQELACVLKNVVLDKDGKCGNYEKIQDE